MSLFDRLRQAARTAADIAMEQPAIRKRVQTARDVYGDARRVVEARLETLESDLWSWVQRMQIEAQKAGRQAERRRSSRHYYGVLGLEPGADMGAIKAAYRKQMRAHHPDKFASDPHAEAQAQAKAQEINEAYRELTALLTGRENRRAD